ncbi:MAG: hypothetical protein RLZZ546_2741 [Bacteroidota bacterium]
MSPYCAMGNNPVLNADPEGDLHFLVAGLIGGAIHTIMHLIKEGSFDNWNWGAFAGSVAAGMVGNFVGPALESARIGGFYGGAILGGSTGFTQTLVSGVWNKNLNGLSLLQSTLIGAGIGGLSAGIQSEIDGYRFLDGRSKIMVERYQLASGITPSTEESINQISGQSPMSKGEAIEKGEVGLINKNVVDKVGTANSNVRNINQGFEGDLRLRGNAYVPEGREFYVNVDGKDIFRTKGGRIDKLIPSNGKNISWGYRGTAIQQRTIIDGVSIGVTVRANSYLYITGNHRGWNGFLFWGR